MRKLFLLAAMCACANQPPVKEAIGPDGTKHYSLWCGDKDYCMKLAGETCPSGYDIVDGMYLKPKKSGSALIENTTTVNVNIGSNSESKPLPDNRWVVKCKS